MAIRAPAERARLGRVVGLRRRRRNAERWSTISTIAALLASFFAGWAAWETRNGSLETGKATRASVWLQMLTEYAEPEMLNAMKELRKWRERDPANFANRFRALLLTAEENDETKNLDEHRRRVYSFFNKLRVLVDGGVIDEQFVSATWGSGTHTYVAQVLIPLERAKADALLKVGALTQEDYVVGNAIQDRLLTFFDRVAIRSKSVQSAE